MFALQLAHPGLREYDVAVRKLTVIQHMTSQRRFLSKEENQTCSHSFIESQYNLGVYILRITQTVSMCVLYTCFRPMGGYIPPPIVKRISAKLLSPNRQ